MDFSQALAFLKSGSTLRRKGWATAGAYIYLEHWRMMLQAHQAAPCVCWCVPGKPIQPGWLCSQADMLAEDWEVCKHPEEEYTTKS